jgi:periplasmic divalent cation tolerance protein
MTELLQVTTALPSEEQAHTLARALVERRLAACGQVLGPMTSIYWWNRTVTTDQEWLVVLKTRADRYAALEAAIRDQHPYAVPEILATPVTAASQPYAEWVQSELADPAAPPQSGPGP